VLAAFAPRDTFFLHNFSFFLSSQTLQSFVQIYPENCLNQDVLSLEFFTEDSHLHRQATRIQNEDKGDRSNNGSAQKFKHTEIGEEAIAMAVQTLDGLLPHPLLRRVCRRVAVRSAGEQPQCHRNVGTRSHCVSFCHHQFQGQPILIPLQQKQTNFDKFCYRFFDKKNLGRFWKVLFL
jgi:hypothetical protein